MSASDPVGGQKFWFNGIPYTGLARPGADTKGLKFWFNGIPVSTLMPATAQTYAAFSTPQHSLSQVVQRMIGY